MEKLWTQRFFIRSMNEFLAILSSIASKFLHDYFAFDFIFANNEANLTPFKQSWFSTRKQNHKWIETESDELNGCVR